MYLFTYLRTLFPFTFISVPVFIIYPKCSDPSNKAMQTKQICPKNNLQTFIQSGKMNQRIVPYGSEVFIVKKT